MKNIQQVHEENSKKKENFVCMQLRGSFLVINFLFPLKHMFSLFGMRKLKGKSFRLHLMYIFNSWKNDCETIKNSWEWIEWKRFSMAHMRLCFFVFISHVSIQQTRNLFTFIVKNCLKGWEYIILHPSSFRLSLSLSVINFFTHSFWSFYIHWHGN